MCSAYPAAPPRASCILVRFAFVMEGYNGGGESFTVSPTPKRAAFRNHAWSLAVSNSTLVVCLATRRRSSAPEGIEVRPNKAKSLIAYFPFVHENLIFR